MGLLTASSPRHKLISCEIPPLSQSLLVADSRQGRPLSFNDVNPFLEVNLPLPPFLLLVIPHRTNPSHLSCLSHHHHQQQQEESSGLPPAVFEMFVRNADEAEAGTDASTNEAVHYSSRLLISCQPLFSYISNIVLLQCNMMPFTFVRFLLHVVHFHTK